MPVTPIDVFLYTLACAFGLSIALIAVVLAFLLIVVIADRKLITPEYERKKRNNEL